MNLPENRITTLKEQISRKKQAQEVLEKTRSLLKSEQEKLKQEKLSVKKEYDDVLRLEESSLASVFYQFMGSKEKRLDKERQEYLAAKLKYDACKETIARLEEDIRRQESVLNQLGNPEEEYKNLIETKSEKLKAQNDPVYAEITNKLDNSYKWLIETDEAIQAGEKALQGLGKAIRSMSKAKGWGTFDMLGGGMIATAVKHSHIDHAKDEIQQVQYLLKKFNRELQDIREFHPENIETDFGGFNKVADFFFDNLIFDWVVQNRIHNSLDNLMAAHNKIKKILTALKHDLAISKKQYQANKNELASYLEKN